MTEELDSIISKHLRITGISSSLFHFLRKILLICIAAQPDEHFKIQKFCFENLTCDTSERTENKGACVGRREEREQRQTYIDKDGIMGEENQMFPVEITHNI